MEKYHKIQTVWLRDPETKMKTLLEGQWAREEFDYLKNLNWKWREKIDGTNIRVMWHREGWQNDPMAFPLEFAGKTDKANVQPSLLARLPELFPPSKMHDMFANKSVCLYGEGYGFKIQKAGKFYLPNSVDFILFDVWIDGHWLNRENVENIANGLGIKVVPIIGSGTLMDMIVTVRAGIGSRISEKPQVAEGIVAVPEIDLFGRNGKRVITKIKWKDFPADQRGNLLRSSQQEES